MTHYSKPVLMACVVLLSLALNPATGRESRHQHHRDTAHPTLRLDAGKKWNTDATLRLSMTDLNQSFNRNSTAIHQGGLAPAAYRALARDVKNAVSRMVSECKLEPAADAQLHIILGELIQGADEMSDAVDRAKARHGAYRVIKAINTYGHYFEDPGFKKLILPSE